MMMIVNTHTHGDHVSGNVEFPAEVDIVTHANTAANMKEMRRTRRQRQTRTRATSSKRTTAKGCPSGRLPTR